MDQPIQYYLGANSSEGFVSVYDTLFSDPRVRQVWIIKGGPGNGKSTFMRTLGAAAEQEGASTEQILCSADPDSLDGLLIPAIGLAVVDGTAPHVVEPILCGLESRYLDFSGCYREGMEAVRAELMQTVAANQRCYTPAYACLQAAGILRRRLQEAAEEYLASGENLLLVQKLADAELPPRNGQGSSVRRFFSAITPFGKRSGLTAVRRMSRKLYLLSDRYGLACPVLKALADTAVKRGYFCLMGSSPLLPDQIEQVVIPELSLAFARLQPHCPSQEGAYCRIDLDALTALPEGERNHAGFLETTAEELEREAVAHLRAAKAHHDRLEKLCRPYVDFHAVDQLQARYTQQVLARLAACRARQGAPAETA